MSQGNDASSINHQHFPLMGLSGNSAGKRTCLQCSRPGLIPGSGWFTGEGIPTPVFLGFPGGSADKE